MFWTAGAADVLLGRFTTKKLWHEKVPYLSVFSRDVTIKKQQHHHLNEANLRSILNTIWWWRVVGQPKNWSWLISTGSFKYQTLLNIKPVKANPGYWVCCRKEKTRPLLRDQWKMRYETSLRGESDEIHRCVFRKWREAYLWIEGFTDSWPIASYRPNWLARDGNEGESLRKIYWKSKTMSWPKSIVNLIVCL